MKPGHWLSRRSQAEPGASQFASALDRVREMRQESAWEPLTPPSGIQERAQRVTTVRKRITVPPLAGERAGQTIEYPVRVWLREAFEATLVVIAGALVILLVWLSLFAD